MRGVEGELDKFAVKKKNVFTNPIEHKVYILMFKVLTVEYQKITHKNITTFYVHNIFFT